MLRVSFLGKGLHSSGSYVLIYVSTSLSNLRCSVQAQIKQKRDFSGFNIKHYIRIFKIFSTI